MAPSDRSNQIGKTACAKPPKIVAKLPLERHADVLAEDLPMIYDYIAVDNIIEANRVLDAIDKTLT